MARETTIRRYEPEDQAGIEWLYQRTPPAGRVYVRPEPVPDEIKEISRNFAAIWVAIEPQLDGDAIIGMVAADRANVDPVEKPVPDFVDATRTPARVFHMWVAPERQRMGIGTRLMAEAMNWAIGQGFAGLILETTSEQEGAIAFYEALGFREIGRTQYRRWTPVWMGKLLEEP